MSPLRDPAITPKIKCLFQIESKYNEFSFLYHNDTVIKPLIRNGLHVPA